MNDIQELLRLKQESQLQVQMYQFELDRISREKQMIREIKQAIKDERQ